MPFAGGTLADVLVIVPQRKILQNPCAINQVVRGIGHLAKVKDRDGRWPDTTQVYMTPVRESRAMGEAITNVGPIRDKLC